MREIKFRGKRKDTGEWIYGDYCSLPNSNIVFVNSNSEIDAENIIPETVGQFSGLTDKNGNEIYEGDIIEVLDSQNRPCRHLVRFSDHRGGYVQYLYKAEDIIVEPFDAGLLWQQYITEQGKYVIGNIYDNPELVNNEKTNVKPQICYKTNDPCPYDCKGLCKDSI